MSDNKMNKIQQIKLKFDKFKPQRSEFLTKFAHQIKTEVVKMFAKNIYQSDTPPLPNLARY
ncbi:hypothetical protein [Campylobacter concisus]|uniref:hypothetical protein n=1 Tax=Campylobacter concisus TaxID=199 RepID=UPI000CD845FB|nr:hypothetical protein [Campylobacter concisus]MBF0916482.1 hypothetical protein [Campylobacter sp.]